MSTLSDPKRWWLDRPDIDETTAVVLEEQLQKGIRHFIDKYVPPRYRGHEVDHEAVHEWLLDPHDVLYLTGPVGTGKTYLAYAAIEWWIRQAGSEICDLQPKSVETWTLPRLLDATMPGRRPEDKYGNEVDVVWWAARKGLLLLDDFGAHKMSEYQESVLYRLLDERYVEQRPTILTTNLLAGEVANHYGDRLASRLAEGATVVALTGADRRRS